MRIAGIGATTMEAYRAEDPNKGLSDIEGERFILDAEVLGRSLKPSLEETQWMSSKAGATMTVLARTLGELTAGRVVARCDPGYRARLDTAFRRASDRIDFVIMPTQALHAAEAEFMALPEIDSLLARRPSNRGAIEGRLAIAVAAAVYDMTILSANGFFRDLAVHTTLHGGVFDPSRRIWIVEPGRRPGRVQDKVASCVAGGRALQVVG